MKKLFYLLLTLLSTIQICLAQSKYNLNEDNIKGDTLSNKFRILYVISFFDKPSLITENIIVPDDDIDSAVELPFDKCVEIRKPMKAATIWLLKLKSNNKYISLSDIFNLFNVDRKDQFLPVRIDNWVTNHPETVVADQSEIVDVDVVNNNSKGINYINIITRHPPQKMTPKKGEVIIH